MTMFYACENWRAHGHRVTVHVASCPFCNDGRGVRGGTSASNGTCGTNWVSLPRLRRHWNAPPGLLQPQRVSVVRVRVASFRRQHLPCVVH